MAIGSSWPWTDHEKKVCLRLSAAISALLMLLAADSMAITGSVRRRRGDRATSADCRRCASGHEETPRRCGGASASVSGEDVGWGPVAYSSVRTTFSQL